MEPFHLSISNNRDLAEDECCFFMAAELYESGQLNSDQAASMVGVPKHIFLGLMLDKFDVTYIRAFFENLMLHFQSDT